MLDNLKRSVSATQKLVGNTMALRSKYMQLQKQMHPTPTLSVTVAPKK